MKKLMLAGVCGALLISCANSCASPADGGFRRNVQFGLIATGVALAGTAVGFCAKGISEVSLYYKAYSALWMVKDKYSEIIELIEKIDLFTYDCQNAANDLVLLHGAAEYSYLEAVTAIDRILPGLQKASRGFRNTMSLLVCPKYWFLKNWAHEQFEKVDALIKNANEVATIIKSRRQFIEQVEKIERLRRERQKLEIDMINAQQPKNQVQVKHV